MGTFLPGTQHPRYKNGKTITRKGYVRITAGPDRGKYEHRAVIEGLLGRPLRWDEEVHHQDFHRAHNCPENLILMDKVIHDFFSAEHGRKKRLGYYLRKTGVDKL